MRPAAAVLTMLAGAWLVGAALSGLAGPLPPIESIPLPAAAVATPVRFPTVPPIKATPLFVSTAETPIPLSPWHRQTLMRWYLPEPDMHPGAH